MAAKQVRNMNAHISAEFTELFGPAPLFKIEDKTIYEGILEGLAQEERPQSFIAHILLRDVADLVYQRLWLRSVGSRLIRQAHKDKIRKDVHAVIELANLLRGRASDKAIDADKQKRLTELEKAEGGPVDEAALFLGWIGNYERVQSLLAAADKRLSDTLKLLDEYRDGLGERVRQIAGSLGGASPGPRSSTRRRGLHDMSVPQRSRSSTRYLARSKLTSSGHR